MIKIIAITAGLVSGTMCALGQWTEPSAVNMNMTEEEAMNIIGEFAQFMNELTSALESATDPASADAAVERLNTLKLSARDLQARMDLIQTAPPEIQQKLLPIVLGIVMEQGQRVSVAIERIKANDYYGCQALRECLSELQAQ